MNYLDSLKFDDEDFKRYKKIADEKKSSQAPHTLFIGCSDSRLVPSLITKTMAGEIFVIRNIANFVPPFREMQEHFATTSAIEYAVQVLNVDNIVVCGHTNCGGCHALYSPDYELEFIPHVKKWLELGKFVKEKAISNFDLSDERKQSWYTEQINILYQMENLLTYPFIKHRYNHKKINIYGWYYIVESGEVYQYSEESNKFELIK
jgi:carbonic anhydrase